ncbi:MAG TPA: enoyl-CoA hydratase-related protein, partial [Thermoanaerobaculia bacterium]|nr:enoyl-CoA hydratase-related protein [Thermoanaerobaculia bacterium]
MTKVRFADADGISRITLTDPPLNILDIEMLSDLREALKRVDNDRILLVIDADGEKSFSAGASV